jgi:hypothetical protein
LFVYILILDGKEFEEQGECFFDIRRKIFISGTKAIQVHVYGLIMIKNIKVRTRFVTERAIFIHGMFSNRALGGQWTQKVTRRTGVTGGERAPGNHGQGAGMDVEYFFEGQNN